MDSEDTTLDFWQGKFCVLACDHDVAIQNHFDAPAVRAAVDGSDHGFARRVAAGDRAEPMDAAGRVLLLISDTPLLVSAPPGHVKRFR